MLATLGTYVTQMFTWLGVALTDDNLQPFFLVVAAVGIVGSICGLALWIASLGRRRRGR